MNQVNQTARPTRIAAWDLLNYIFSGIWSLYATSFGGRYQI